MWRLGTVPYLNALPLVEGLRTQPGVDLIEELPARLAPRLRAGDLDLALVSSVELFREPRLGWIEGPAITSCGAVKSILLYLRRPLPEVRSLGLDSSSRSAAVLAQVCLRGFAGLDPLDVSLAPPDRTLDTLEQDAVLRIGDPALSTDPLDREVLDLGTYWTDQTGLPFVYALWLTRPDLDGAGIVPLLEQSRRVGLAQRERLAEDFARANGLPVAQTQRYLAEHIGFELGAAEREGLERFGAMAHELGLVDRPELPPPTGRVDASPGA